MSARPSTGRAGDAQARAAEAAPGALGRALARLPEPLRVLVRDVWAAEGRLDAVACDARGGAVAVLRAAPGRDRAALTDLTAHVGWLAARLGDWRALAPDLPLDPEAAVAGLLLAEDFDPRTRAAAAARAGAGLRLARWHAPPAALRGEPWIELLETPGAPATRPAGAAPSRPATRSRFRTGLAEPPGPDATTRGEPSPRSDAIRLPGDEF